MILGKLNSYMQKNETKPPPYTTHENELQIDQRLEVRPETKKRIKDNMGGGVRIGATSNYKASPQ